MENSYKEEILESSSIGVYKLPGEPAVLINGLPPMPLADSSLIGSAVNDAKPAKFTGFGEWLVGRQVRKLFGKQYFTGEVTQYDEEMGWYKVAYEDGDTEDLEWHELEKVLIPLDINIPIKSMMTKIAKKQKSVQQSAKRKVRTGKNVVSSVKGKENESNTH